VSGYYDERNQREVVGFDKLYQQALNMLYNSKEIHQFMGEESDLSRSMDKDLGWLSRNFLALGYNAKDTPVISELYGQLNTLTRRIKNSVQEGQKEIYKLFKDVGRSDLNFIQEHFRQVFSNSDKNKTGGVTVPFTQEYYDRVLDAKHISRDFEPIDYNKFYNSSVDEQRQMIKDVKTKEAESYDRSIKERKKHEDLIDPRLLLNKKALSDILPGYESSDYFKDVSHEESVAYGNKLKKMMGSDDLYNQYLQNVKDKIFDFIADRQCEKNHLVGMYGENTEKINQRLSLYDHASNPLIVADYWEKGFPVQEIDDNIVNSVNHKFVETIPNKPEYYDNHYKSIEANPKMYKLYKAFIEKNTELLGVLPQEDMGFFQKNAMVKMALGFFDDWAQNGLPHSGASIVDNYFKHLSKSTSDSIANYLSKNPDDAENIKIRTLIRISYQDQVKTAVDIWAKQYQIDHNDTPTAEMSEKQRRFETNKLAEADRFDLQASLLHCNVVSHTYQNQTEVFPRVKALKYIIENLKDKSNRPLVRANQLATYNINQAFGLQTIKEHEVGEKVYSLREKEQVAKLEKLRDGYDKQLKEGRITRDEWNEQMGDIATKMGRLGGKIVPSRIARDSIKQVTAVNFAVNIPYGVSALLRGFAQNLNEGSGKRFFTNKDVFWAYTHATGFIFNHKGELAQKIFNVVDKMCVVQSRKDYLKTGATLTQLGKNIKKYGLGGIMNFVEYTNQVVGVMSYLKHHNLIDKIMTDGSIPSLSDKEFMDLSNSIGEMVPFIYGDYTHPLMKDETTTMRLLTMWQRFIGGLVYNRVGGKRDIPGLGEVEGRYRAYGHLFKKMGIFPAFIEINKQLVKKLAFQNTTFEKVDGLSDLDVYNMRKNMTEIVMVATLTTLMLGLMNGIAQRKKDKKGSAILVFWLNRMSLLQQDMTFILNPSYWSHKSKNISPMLNYLNNIGKTTTDAIDVIMGGDGTYKNGWMAGQNKLGRDINKILPVMAGGQKLFDSFKVNMEGGIVKKAIERSINKK
jgi:hypothetical protein